MATQFACPGHVAIGSGAVSGFISAMEGIDDAIVPLSGAKSVEIPLLLSADCMDRGGNGILLSYQKKESANQCIMRT